MPDGRVTMCQECHVEFTLIVRRHHCRACGRVICNACSNCEAPLKWNDFKAERVCYICYEELRKSTSFDKIFGVSCRHQIHSTSYLAGIEIDPLLKMVQKRFKASARVVMLASNNNVNSGVPRRLRVSAKDDGSVISGYLHKGYFFYDLRKNFLTSLQSNLNVQNSCNLNPNFSMETHSGRHIRGIISSWRRATSGGRCGSWSMTTCSTRTRHRQTPSPATRNRCWATTSILM